MSTPVQQPDDAFVDRFLIDQPDYVAPYSNRHDGSEADKEALLSDLRRMTLYFDYTVKKMKSHGSLSHDHAVALEDVQRRWFNAFARTIADVEHDYTRKMSVELRSILVCLVAAVRHRRHAEFADDAQFYVERWGELFLKSREGSIAQTPKHKCMWLDGRLQHLEAELLMPKPRFQRLRRCLDNMAKHVGPLKPLSRRLREAEERAAVVSKDDGFKFCVEERVEPNGRLEIGVDNYMRGYLALAELQHERGYADVRDDAANVRSLRAVVQMVLPTKRRLVTGVPPAQKVVLQALRSMRQRWGQRPHVEPWGLPGPPTRVPRIFRDPHTEATDKPDLESGAVKNTIPQWAIMDETPVDKDYDDKIADSLREFQCYLDLVVARMQELAPATEYEPDWRRFEALQFRWRSAVERGVTIFTNARRCQVHDRERVSYVQAMSRMSRGMRVGSAGQYVRHWQRFLAQLERVVPLPECQITSSSRVACRRYNLLTEYDVVRGDDGSERLTARLHDFVRRLCHVYPEVAAIERKLSQWRDPATGGYKLGLSALDYMRCFEAALHLKDCKEEYLNLEKAVYNISTVLSHVRPRQRLTEAGKPPQEGQQCYLQDPYPYLIQDEVF